MSDFSAHIRHRMSQARQSMVEAEETGDEYLAQVMAGELEGLERLAADHQVVLDDATGAVERSL